MGIYSDVIREKSENDRLLERYADQSLRDDRNAFRLEEEVDDAQTAVLFILDKFGLAVDRQHGLADVDTLLDTLLDPLGMMYNYVESPAELDGAGSEYALAFREDGKAVALYPSALGRRYFCPSDSSGGFATKAFRGNLKKGCYIFHKPLPEGRSTLGTFALHVLRSISARDGACMIAATALGTLLGFAIPVITKWVYKTYIPDPAQSGGWFALALLLYLSVVASRAALRMLKALSLSGVKVRVSTSVQSAVMASVLNRPMSFFRETTSGRLSTRIGNCEKLSGMILDIALDVLLNFSFSLAYLFQVRSLNAELFAPAVIFLALRIGAAIISALFNMVNQSSQMRADAESNGFLNSAIRGIQKIKTTGSESIIYAKWSEYYRQKLFLTYRKPFFLKYSANIMAALTTLATIVLLRGAMISGTSGGDYLVFTSAYALIISAVDGMTDIMQNLFFVHALCDSIRPLLAGREAQKLSTEYVRRLRGGIRAENLHFAYPGTLHGCLEGVSMTIKPGEKVAIVGESGCGKSTLLKLLIGMERLDEGNVFYDGQLLNALNQRSLRRCIGSVFQFSRLFPGTILENVCQGNAGRPDEEKVWAALDFAGCGDYVRSLPLKLETEISESNSNGFSGGQRQMLLLARAVLNHPGVMILDEATSALDNLTQERVLRNIRGLRSTVVMVAHRLSTVVGFDRIIMLADGRIVEEGSYQALIERNGAFAALVRKQMIDQ